MASASKRQKHRDIPKEDRLSRLPDQIVCHILSFLETKDAVRTSILSRRWRYTWASVANLRFVDSDFPTKKRVSGMKSFVNFVNRVLILRSHPTVKSFKLRLVNSYSASDVESWIWAAITHSVQELKLLMQHMYQLPSVVFTCPSVMVLKLRSGIDLNNIPQFIFLPSLKVLHLKDECRLSDSSLERLVSGSPILEELVMDRFDDLNIINVKSSSLKRFKIHNSTRLERKLSVVVDAPKLEFLELFDHDAEDYDIDIKNSLSIVQATISFIRCPNNVSETYGDQMVQLLSQICSVKTLSLSLCSLEALVKLPEQNWPCFHNLTELVLEACKWFLPPVIVQRTFPNLKALVLKKYYCCESHPRFRSLEEKYVYAAQNLKSSAETLEFNSFEGNVGEMRMVEYFLKNSTVLKKIIFPSYINDVKLLKKLLMFPRGSNTCEILFS